MTGSCGGGAVMATCTVPPSTQQVTLSHANYNKIKILQRPWSVVRELVLFPTLLAGADYIQLC